MKVGIVNYGMGNLGSVRRALEDLGVDAFIAEHPAALSEANRAILPGVGAFGEGMARLHEGGWTQAIAHFVNVDRKPFLGICLGMQMLVTEGEEGGINAGLGLIEGRVRHLDALGCELRVPHVGWNEVTFAAGQPLFAHIPQQSDFYFVHSFAVEAAHERDVAGTTMYGVKFAVALRRENVFATQFHPEKSSKAGRQVLRNFLEYVAC